MSRRRGKVQVFNISFLDVLSCALGGVLLLLLLNMDASQQAAAEAASRAAAWEDWSRQKQAEIDSAVAELGSERQARQSAEEASRQAKAAQAALIGWQGPLKNVVFVFDTSGSMSGPRFPYYKDILKRWVQNYPFEQFNVIRFSSDVSPFSPDLVAATPETRQRAGQFIDEFNAGGSTDDTKGALEAAFHMNGIDTIILLSDGQPDGGSDYVLDFVRRNKPQNVFINSIAMGDHHGSHRQFLADLAAIAGGSFQGI